MKPTYNRTLWMQRLLTSWSQMQRILIRGDRCPEGAAPWLWYVRNDLVDPNDHVRESWFTRQYAIPNVDGGKLLSETP